jgi:hypothetical protein
MTIAPRRKNKRVNLTRAEGKGSDGRNDVEGTKSYCTSRPPKVPLQKRGYLTPANSSIKKM